MEPIIATYYLTDETGYVVAKIEATDVDRCLIGKCYSAISWSAYDPSDVGDWHFVADVYCKFDSCTHWNFYGEDYDPETNTESDSYYHICGPECFKEHIMNMCFVWKVAEMVLKDYYGNDPVYVECIEENYEVNGFTGKLVDMMLKRCLITKC